MITLGELLDQHDATVLDYLDRQAEIPTVTRAGIQGDISFLRVTTAAATKPIPAAGIVVATGRSGHDHRILPAGFLDLAPVGTDSLAIGTLTVPEGSQAFVLHDEHGGLAFAPGTYRIGRQREMADEIRNVED
jgi:hypothetical protein